MNTNVYINECLKTTDSEIWREDFILSRFGDLSLCDEDQAMDGSERNR